MNHNQQFLEILLLGPDPSPCNILSLHSKAGLAHQRRHMSTTLGKTVQWSPEDDILLHKLALAGEKLESIASNLKRSAGSVRVRAYRLKIKLGKSGKLMNHPAWLELSSDRMSFVLMENRANTVKMIFELSAAGLGGYSIAKRLNSHNVSTFGSVQKWDQSAIDHILTNPAVTGRRISKLRSGDETQKVTAEQYYPKVVESEFYDLVQQTRKKNLVSGRGRKGAMVTNLFSNTLTCAYCSSAILFENNNHSKSLICSSARENAACIGASWPYDDFEMSFFKFVKNVEVEKLFKRADQKGAAKLKDLVEQSFSYDTRLDLSLFIKESVAELQLACAGFPTKPEPKSSPHAGHTRSFKIRFHGGPIFRWPRITSSIERAAAN